MLLLKAQSWSNNQKMLKVIKNRKERRGWLVETCNLKKYILNFKIFVI